MYSSSNMLRARKKDASFKPNRVLDKKSSRGMLYENEELRLRSIHFNDEIDRSQHDIKKLKKENDHLKREIWSLRDEYSKMEEKLNKVLSNQDISCSGGMVYGEYDEEVEGGAQGSYVFDENGSTYMVSETDDGSPPDYPNQNHLAQHYQMVAAKQGESRKCSAASGTTMYDSEDEEINYMLMVDEDNKSMDSSYAGLNQQQQAGPSTTMMPHSLNNNVGEELQFIEAEVESHYPSTSSHGGNNQAQIETSFTYSQQPQPYWQYLTSVPPDLEVVTEESEHTNSNNTHNNSPTPKMSPSPNLVIHEATPEIETPEIDSPLSNPTIEITPATSPNHTTSSNSTTNNSGESPTAFSTKEDTPDSKAKTTTTTQELGCLTTIPQTFQASSQLTINPDGEIDIESSSNSQPSIEINENLNATEAKPTPRRKSTNSKCANMCDNKFRRRKYSLSSRKGSLQNKQLASQPPFPGFYQSEPSLNSLGSFHPSAPRNAIRAQQEEELAGEYNKRRNTFDSNSSRMVYPAAYNSSSLGWNSGGDKNVVIGYIEGVDSSSSMGNDNKSNYELRGLGVKEIIDQLETQFDPSLENVSSVRVMSSSGLTRIFIILKNSTALKLLVEKGLTLNIQSSGDREQATVRVRLIDASTESSILILSGLPPDNFLDSTIVSFLNQFGQVVGPFERRFYKGIDISECQIQIHLVKPIPSTFSISGYEIQAKICQRQEANIEPTHLTTVTRPPIVMLQQNPPSVIQIPTNNSSVKVNSEQTSLPVHQPLSRTTKNISQLPNSTSTTGGGQSPRFLRQGSPSPSVQTIASQNTTPLQTPVAQVKGGHAGVRRSISSAPRLESTGLNPNSANSTQGIGGRKIAVCHGILEEDVISHLSNAQLKHGGSSTNLNSNLQQQANVIKRQLSRLPVSQGNTITGDFQQHASGIPTPGSTLSNKPFYRSMSFDPRRGSNASRQQQPDQQMVNAIGRISLVEGVNGRRDNNGRMHMQQMNERNGKSKLGPANSQNDSEKSLPWCGCWGNGCL